ncbi:hypothetical protein FKP32DRAFT_1679691 [Trametes sanguinea]|nr:hypothetical protein FKP32DRAFT_1679691 [Trametes sanguinea]
MFADDSESEDEILQIPLYIHLPPRADDGHRRDLLLCIFVSVINHRSTWIEATWDEIDVPQPYQPAPEIPPPSTPYIHGVRTFIPINALLSPIYILVGHVNGFRLQRRLLIAATVCEHPARGGSVRIDVEFDVMTLPRRPLQQIGRPRDLATLHSLRHLFLSSEPYLLHLRNLLVSLIDIPSLFPAEDTEHGSHGDGDSAEEMAVENMLTHL